MKTVTLGLNDFVGFMGTTDWGATFAAINSRIHGLEIACLLAIRTNFFFTIREIPESRGPLANPLAGTWRLPRIL